MRNQSIAACVSIAAGLACAVSALGQDSVSTGSGLPGDANSAYTVAAGSSNTQRKDYILDLVGKTSTWGATYRFGPLAKCSAGGNTTSGFKYFTQLMGSQAASNRFLNVTSFLLATYPAWQNAGEGVNATQNAAASDDGSGLYGPAVNAAGYKGQQFGAAFMEFGAGFDNTFGNGDDQNNVVTMVADFQRYRPSRLYVSRIMSATNRTSNAGGDTSTASLGLGGVDESGVTHISIDGYGMASGASVTDKRLARVNALSRNTAVVNAMSSSGAVDSANTNLFLTGSNTNTTTPTIIPSSIAGRSVIVGGDFLGQYRYEQTANLNTLASNTSYLAVNMSPRGPVSFTSGVFTRLSNGTSDAGTMAVLSRDQSVAAASQYTRGISVWTVNTDGSVDTSSASFPMRLVLPTSGGGFVAQIDGFDPGAASGLNTLATQEFTNYSSQVSFRGGSGPVALAVLSSGELMAAATVASTGLTSQVPQGMDQYIAVARMNQSTGATTWTIAAHTGGTGGAASGTSKAIESYDPNTGIYTTVGRIARYSEVFSGATNGPSISSPSMDRDGNLYFLATVSLTSPTTRQTTALLKANFIPATNQYRLEMLAAVGDVIHGANSNTNYQIQYMGTADSDSVDSGAVFAGNIVQDYMAGVIPGAYSYGCSYSLGAMVVRMKIVYDIDGDGQYLDPTLSGNSGSIDQAYNVAMVVTGGYRPTDYDSSGEVNPVDLLSYLFGYFSSPADPRADYNGDGQIDPVDLLSYLHDYFGGI